jgi:putative oxidoreductase
MLTRLLSPRVDLAYTFLRVVSGLMFLCHGLQKIFGFLTDTQPPVGSQIWIGGILELVGGSLVALGLCTRIAAFIASGMMAVAYTQFHWKGALDTNFFPVVNKGELALLYAFLFLYVACRGGGPWSIDALRSRTGDHRPTV